MAGRRGDESDFVGRLEWSPYNGVSNRGEVKLRGPGLRWELMDRGLQGMLGIPLCRRLMMLLIPN